MDETQADSMNVVTVEPVPNDVDECNEQTDNAELNQSDERKLIVGEILDEVVETVIQDDKVRADNESEAATDVATQTGIESIPMPKDDPETAFFLSLS